MPFSRRRCCFTSGNNRDIRILQHIISYCDQIEEAVSDYGRDYQRFLNSSVYRNAVSLCILQIGELVGNLSETFRLQNTTIPWRNIRLMRNIVVHRYGTVDHAITWDVVNNDIPVLKQFCYSILDQSKEEDSEHAADI